MAEEEKAKEESVSKEGEKAWRFLKVVLGQPRMGGSSAMGTTTFPPGAVTRSALSFQATSVEFASRNIPCTLARESRSSKRQRRYTLRPRVASD